jgi:hypothetical protein
MKKLTLALILLFVVATAMTAFAADRRVTFTSPTVVNGQKLPAGDYVMRLTVNGKTATVVFLQKDKEVAKFNGQVVETDAKPIYDAVVRVANPDGTSNIKEIQTANKKDVIRIEGETAVGK